MIKTIDTANITDEMIAAVTASEQICTGLGMTDRQDITHDSIMAALVAAPAVEPAQFVKPNHMQALAIVRPVKENPIARKIVANLMWRKRQALRSLLHVLETKASDHLISMYSARHAEIHNAAEASRRLLYGIDP